jgi:hypothetical protein
VNARLKRSRYDRDVTMPREFNNQEHDGRYRTHPDMTLAFLIPAGICPRGTTAGMRRRAAGTAPTGIWKI